MMSNEIDEHNSGSAAALIGIFGAPVFPLPTATPSGLDDLNQENPATAGELKNWISWLRTETGVDGLRVDTAKHVPKWFWRDFDAAANTFTISEVFSGDPVYVADYSNYLDATLDFPLYYTIKNVFAKNFLQST